MPYHWKCNKHNEVMNERLSENRSGIIPYCSTCLAEIEFNKIVKEQDSEYDNKLYSYEKNKNRSKYSFKPIHWFLIPVTLLELIATVKNPDIEDAVLLYIFAF
ncbi:hypothetical protein B0G93_106177 [Bacillus sp. V-88]|nr:hypothetical protein B1B00_09110 [Bacillus sp. DSM 27956]PRX77141.1 hypothetical protein B0G93_106177 [Bacillus sp. V-88]SLK21486.1 hypothetical protein SAMN06295884_106177 [Bacillus sp. V-88]